jgi:hypothetical protein
MKRRKLRAKSIKEGGGACNGIENIKNVEL